MKREEGTYLIKRVDSLPVRGNFNHLYIIKGESFSTFYLWDGAGRYNEIKVDSSDIEATLVRDKLQQLSGDDRLDVSFIKGITTDNPGSIGEDTNSFEVISQNIKSYPSTLHYNNDLIERKVYTLPSGTITKTFGYNIDNEVVSITLSGDLPLGVDTVKTLNYTNGKLTSITYS